MKIKLSYKFLAVLAAVILLVGCTGGGGSGTKTLTSYVGGDQGLSIEFNEDEPPKEVLDNDEESFFVSLVLKNEGEYTIKRNEIIASLSGISKDDFGLSSLDAENEFELLRKVKDGSTVREGDTDILEIGKGKYKDDLAADFTTTLVADVCYTYRTVAAASLCLKRDTIQHTLKGRRDACDINNENIKVESSGAPVQVTSLRERASGSNEITFSFLVENKGSGDTYEPNTYTSTCSGKEGEEGKAYIKVTSPSGKFSFRCRDVDDRAEGEIRLINGKKTVSCSLDTNSLQETAFEGRVNVEIDYQYRDAIKQDITVKNAVVL